MELTNTEKSDEKSLKPIIETAKVEEFKIKDRPYIQLSDHYGMSIEISLQWFLIIFCIWLRLIKKWIKKQIDLKNKEQINWAMFIFWWARIIIWDFWIRLDFLFNEFVAFMSFQRVGRIIWRFCFFKDLFRQWSLKLLRNLRIRFWGCSSRIRNW